MALSGFTENGLDPYKNNIDFDTFSRWYKKFDNFGGWEEKKNFYIKKINKFYFLYFKKKIF